MKAESVKKHMKDRGGRTGRSTGQKVSSLVSMVLILLILAVAAYVFICNQTGRIAFFGDKAVVKIVSSSMEPAISAGEYIIVEKIRPKDISAINIGDVIVFYSRDPAIFGSLNTHRVTDIITDDSGTQFATKGDNNNAADSLLTSSKDVAGRYIKGSPFITKIASFVMQKWVFFLLLVVPAAIVVLLCVIDVIKKSKEVNMDILVAEKVRELKERDENNPDGSNGKKTENEEKSSS